MGSTQIQKKTYAYCPNLTCPVLTQESSPGMTGSRRYMMEIWGENKDKSVCPHCGAELRRTCPNCGRVFYEKPLKFCPACGQNLLGTKREKICEICGRPFFRSIMDQETVFVCSKACLSIFIQRHVKTCDQCGLRFRAEPGKNDMFTGLQLTHDNSQKLDFCSEKCLEAYTGKMDCDIQILKKLNLGPEKYPGKQDT